MHKSLKLVLCVHSSRRRSAISIERGKTEFEKQWNCSFPRASENWVRHEKHWPIFPRASLYTLHGIKVFFSNCKTARGMHRSVGCDVSTSTTGIREEGERKSHEEALASCNSRLRNFNEISHNSSGYELTSSALSSPDRCDGSLMALRLYPESRA